MSSELKRFEILLKDLIEEQKFQREVEKSFGALIDMCNEIITY